MSILPVFIAAFAIRLISLFISIRNEKKLRAAGAIEYGKINSTVLTIFHVLFYLAALYEGLSRGSVVNNYTWSGIGLFAVSMFFLFMVIRQLGAVWTVKLFIAPGHIVNRSFLFKYIRHPNYFLNIIPELIAIALIGQAWYVLMIGLPLYLIPLTIRIRQEEKVMKEHFRDYQ